MSRKVGRNMPRRKVMTEAELLAERERIDKQISEIREKENTELGELVKKIFGTALPDSKAGRVAFLKELKVYVDTKNKESVNVAVKSNVEFGKDVSEDVDDMTSIS